MSDADTNPSEISRTPLVSACLITYNHARFIRQAIESILMQKVNFPWEFIIADDCSTDGTREIILEYQRRHPSLIRLLLRSSNIGAWRNGQALLSAVEGKYVALLEGDDYWSDEYKLQR